MSVAVPTGALEGWQVTNLLHSGFNVTSANNQGLIISPSTETPNIKAVESLPADLQRALMEATRTVQAPSVTSLGLSPLVLFVGAGLLLLLLLRR
jgi:hypothetical protein